MLKRNVNPAAAGKQILLFITALMLIVAYSQEPVVKTVVKTIEGDTLVEKGGLKYEPDSDEPYSGKAVWYYENGQKKRVENYEDGKVEGILTSWYEDGQKKIAGASKDGKPDGMWTEWYENGQMMEEITFVNGELDGPYTWWYEDGKVNKQGAFKASLMNGKWTHYYENGFVKWSGQLVDGNLENVDEYWEAPINERDGLWIFNNENGKRQSEQTYHDGNLNGQYTAWFENGKREYKGSYSNGRAVGKWTFWDEHGSMKEDLSKLVTNYLKAQPLRTFKIAKQAFVQMGDMISTNISGEILVDLDQRKCRMSATQELPGFGGISEGEVTTELYFTADTVYLSALGETIIVTDEEIRAEAGIGLDSLWDIIDAESPAVFIEREMEDILLIDNSEVERKLGIGSDLDWFSYADLSEVILEEEPRYLLTVDSSYTSELADIMGKLLETEGDVEVSNLLNKLWISKETFYDVKVHERASIEIKGDEMFRLDFEQTADISEHNQPMEIIMPIVNIQPTFFQPDLPPAPLPEPVLTEPKFPSLTEESDFGKVDYNWSIHTLEGEEVQLSKFEDRVVFLNLWATWCKPCRIEMPGIQNLYDELKDEDVVFLLASNENEETVRGFMKNEPYSFPVYLFGEDLPDVFKTRGIPATFIIDRNGKIVFKHMGAAKWDDESCLRFIRSLN